jgi:hypothetical protein
MTSLYLIFGSGLFGVIGHWVTRWSQGRTQSSFWEYLVAYKARTLSSVFANIASSGLIYASTPEDISGRALVLVVIGAYTAGYTLDSTLNKDKSTSDRLMQERLNALNENKNMSKEEFERFDKQGALITDRKSLADILEEDDALGR